MAVGRDVRMQILLKSGTVLTAPIDSLMVWKDAMIGPEKTVTYSTDDNGLIIFRSTDIDEILVPAEEIAESMITPMPILGSN